MKFLSFALLGLFVLIGCGESATSPLQAVVTEYRSTGKEPAFPQFLQRVVSVGRVPLVYFYADWCGPCRRLRTALPSNEVDAALQRTTVILVNVDSCQELARSYGVSAVPTLVKVDAQGQPVATITSAEWDEDVPAEIAPVLAKLVNSNAFDRRK
jgi:thioredoxin 1